MTAVLVPAEPAMSEYTVRNSRFISEVFPVSDASDAREKLREQKERYSDASHVVHAFVTGESGGTCGCSDDGEPPGTSGRPTLEVLRGSGMTDILLTTVRYFGGVKLGTGGLVKAYTESAQRVLRVCRPTERAVRSLFSVSVPYDGYDGVRRLLSGYDIEGLSEVFEGLVTVSGRICRESLEEVSGKIRDMTRGRAVWSVSEDGESC